MTSGKLHRITAQQLTAVLTKLMLVYYIGFPYASGIENH